MPKKNKHPTNSENLSCPADSENSIENIKYIKKLEMQRTVLKKLIETDISLAAFIRLIDNETPNSK